ncbi:hypothetical protein NQ315_016325 [Exocentrus adspersus]|uniref:Pseudouridine-5'-phosphatase n=1 Tax=Exocentrus adspersus TaxID=1586481 RepID=A0AAV8VP41_9CUCU|nr:hypothetical protein NQ315_016325 [Exocentrus adspersus]
MNKNKGLLSKKCCPQLPFRKVTHVIFDLDGTIIDTETMIEEVLTEICQSCGKTFKPELHNKTAGAIVEDIAKLLINENDLTMSEEEIVQMYKDLTPSKCANINFMPVPVQGAEQLIRHFAEHQVPIAVATSSTEDLMLLKTNRHREVFNLFHHIVCGGSDPEVKKGKPAPDIFLVCASRFNDNVNPADCLVLEDAPNGVKGALTAGMQAVIIPADDVPYEIWKNATLRLDTLEYMAPELFGLPPLVTEGSAVPKISFTMHYEEGKQREETHGTNVEEELGVKGWPALSISADDTV